MVDAITGFVLWKIGNYLIDEASMLMGVKDDLEELKTELTCIQGFLKDVQARGREDEVPKEWTNLVRDIAYDIEDVLDSYFLKIKERSLRPGLFGLTNKIGEKKDAYKIVDDIKTLKRRILDVTRKREAYSIGALNEHGGGEASISSMRELRRARSFDQHEFVFGLVDDAKTILVKLLGEDKEDNSYIISIFGMGGIGKTTIARKLYNSSDVKRRFDLCAWTYVSQEYNTRDILMRIIRSLGIASKLELVRIKMFSEEELEVYIHDHLERKRYLIVVDDIWETYAWESLKRAFPCNDIGSRVIITTRSRAVAEGLDGRVYGHKLRFLTFEESWELFEHKAFKNIQRVDAELQRIGEEMVEKCRGLPLAIVVLAGILSTKRPNEWYDVRNSLWRRLKDNSIHISNVFDLSFKELHYELKLCFLYLSIFPEDYEIDVEKLIHLLVAEGFIQEDEEMMSEDVARYYIEELIDRSLVEGVKRERGKVMYCRIHDLLRDVAIKKAKELNFVHVYNDNQFSTTCRREVVHHVMDNNYLCDRRVNKRMRSFLFFGEQKSMLGSYVKTENLKLKLLRVLNLGGLMFDCDGDIPFMSLPDVIGKLMHLRYLGIAHTGVRYLPDFISNLQFLQTIDASGNRFEGMTDLRKLTSLRHLMGRFIGELLIGDAVNLQTIKSISSYSWSELMKHKLLINLRNLEIYDSGYIEFKSVCLDLSSFSKLPNLCVLTLRVPTLKVSLEQEEAVWFNMDVIFPSLESLTLVGTKLKEDPMPALEKSPRLEDLVLEDCDCSGVTMSISALGFGRLKKLELFRAKLYELRIEEEAMPSLMKLNLTNSLERRTKLMVPDRFLALIRG
ncbi:unnamed protein product [Cochlearia groenlandica]